MSRKRHTAEALALYAARDVDSVDGMLQTGSISVLLSLFELQDAFGVAGDIAEIGVFHGKTLVLMAHAMNEGERAIAIDIFGRRPGSDRAMRDQLEANLARFGCADACDIITANSLELSPAEFRARLGNANVRLFSVDGDHAREAVLHDLTLAEAVLAPDGVIAADDLFNVWYPGVTEAFYEFCRMGRDGAHDLEPIAFVAPNGPVETGAGKLFFARAPFARAYKAGLKLLNQPDLKHCDPFGGFADVPHFCFRDRPIRRPLDPVLRSILDDIVGSPQR